MGEPKKGETSPPTMAKGDNQFGADLEQPIINEDCPSGD